MIGGRIFKHSAVACGAAAVEAAVGVNADLFLMGKTEVPRSTARLLAGVPPREYAGHILDLPKGGANVVSVRN